MNINHISVSRKQIWDECPAKYKFKYHLKLISEEPEPFYFTYGKIIHKIAEAFVKNKGKTPINDIANDVLNGNIFLEGTSTTHLTDDYKEKFPAHLRALQKLCDRIGYDGHLEYKFEYDLDPPNNKIIVGFIDRLIIRNNKYYIIDYKTSKKNQWRKTFQNISADLQLRCYARVVQKNFNAKAENIRAALYYLEGAEIVDTKFTEESLETAEKELLQAYQQIEATDPDKAWGCVGNHCYRCEFNNHCPFFTF